MKHWQHGRYRMHEAALTTIDNPHDPFTEFLAWFTFDAAHGYHTPSVLARLVRSSPELSYEEQLMANEAVIDELINENVIGIYKKVTREIPNPFENEIKEI